jgi:hypothetical protein
MMKKILAAFVFAAVILGAAGCLSVRAEAAVEVTVTNNRTKDIRLAFAWTTADWEEHVYSKGWYSVKAGTTTTVSLADVVYSKFKKLEPNDKYYHQYFHPKNGCFGYYATDGTTAWEGRLHTDTFADENTLEGYTLRGEDFYFYKGERPNTDVRALYIELFRIISVKSSGDGEDGTVSLTFNP